MKTLCRTSHEKSPAASRKRLCRPYILSWWLVLLCSATWSLTQLACWHAAQGAWLAARRRSVVHRWAAEATLSVIHNRRKLMSWATLRRCSHTLSKSSVEKMTGLLLVVVGTGLILGYPLGHGAAMRGSERRSASAA